MLRWTPIAYLRLPYWWAVHIPDTTKCRDSKAFQNFSILNVSQLIGILGQLARYRDCTHSAMCKTLQELMRCALHMLSLSLSKLSLPLVSHIAYLKSVILYSPALGKPIINALLCGNITKHSTISELKPNRTKRVKYWQTISIWFTIVIKPFV